MGGGGGGGRVKKLLVSSTDMDHLFYQNKYECNPWELHTTYRTLRAIILKKDPPPQCEHCQCILTVRHILVECNHLAQTRNYIFGRCGVVESFQFHPELVLKFLRDSEFFQNFNWTKMWYFIYCTALYTVFF